MLLENNFKDGCNLIIWGNKNILIVNVYLEDEFNTYE